MKSIGPGSTVGMIGGGQLGRMFAFAAKRMGFQVIVFSPEQNSPAGQVADLEILADYDDTDALTSFARRVDVATIEFENIPVAAIDIVERHAPVRPAAVALQTIQSRLDEKTFLRSHNLPVAEFAAIRTPDDLAALTPKFPAVLKTSKSGYDGKGQRIVQTLDELTAAWDSFDRVEAVLEAFVNYECEFSVLGVRGEDGTIVCYDPVLNRHENHVLDVSVCPSGLSQSACSRAVEITRQVATGLNYVGVFCVEFFLLPSGDVVINEVAPRPHNSGHLTIEAHATSQFEQQVRAVCGLPLGSTQQRRPAAMANLLGDRWQGGEPNWTSLLNCPNASLHLYGKDEARAGRKMGHITSVADSVDAAVANVERARASLNAESAESDAPASDPRSSEKTAGM